MRTITVETKIGNKTKGATTQTYNTSIEVPDTKDELLAIGVPALLAMVESKLTLKEQTRVSTEHRVKSAEIIRGLTNQNAEIRKLADMLAQGTIDAEEYVTRKTALGL